MIVNGTFFRIIIGSLCIFTGTEIRNLHQPFELDFMEVKEYEAREHRNTFFEMVFVLDGKGAQIIKNHRLPYSSDKLFLIFPQDTPGFEVAETTKICFIRFNDSYLKTQSREWIQKLEFIFHNHNHLPGCILKTITDKPLVRPLIESLVREHINQQPQQQQQEVVKQLINTVITIVARNILLIPMAVSGKSKNDNALQLLNYNYQPELLKSEKIAQQFNVSPT